MCADYNCTTDYDGDGVGSFADCSLVVKTPCEITLVGLQANPWNALQQQNACPLPVLLEWSPKQFSPDCSANPTQPRHDVHQEAGAAKRLYESCCLLALAQSGEAILIGFALPDSALFRLMSMACFDAAMASMKRKITGGQITVLSALRSGTLS